MATMEKIFAAYHERQKLLAANTHPFAKGVAWVEGELTPLHEARIPILDQGFMHSDLTYDVPSVWDGRFFRLDDHITRLEASCTKLRMKLPPPTRRGEADSGRYGCKEWHPRRVCRNNRDAWIERCARLSP